VRWPKDVLDKYYRERILRDEIFEVRRNGFVAGLCVVERRSDKILHLRYAYSVDRTASLELTKMVYDRYKSTKVEEIAFMRRDRYVTHSMWRFYDKIVTLIK